MANPGETVNSKKSIHWLFVDFSITYDSFFQNKMDETRSQQGIFSKYIRFIEP